MKNKVYFTLLLVGATALALPPDPENLPNIVRVAGSVTFTNCNPANSDLIVRVNPGGLAAGSSRSVLADGRVRVNFSKVMDSEATTGNWTVTPSLKAGVCPGGSFSPANRSLTRIPALGLQFGYAVQPSAVRQIPLTTVITTLNQLLASAKLKLNNQGSQTSFVELAGFRLPLTIPRVTVDIDCGLLCPDLGDGHFYLNDINLESARVTSLTNALKLSLAFESAGREIKGYHSKLGDDFMPDFQLDNAKLSLNTQPKVTSSGGLTLAFSAPHLDADIQATGGCSIGGIDVCNKIFGTDRKIQKGVESASVAALNGQGIQSGLAVALGQFLRSQGINGRVLSARIAGGSLVLELQ